MAEESGYLISEELHRVLVEMIHEYHAASVNQRGRGVGVRPEHEEPSTPEVYVARAPEGGIPVLYEMCITGTGSGTGTHYLPGFTECDIYKLLEGKYGMELVALEDTSRQVYNITACKVEEDSWVIVERDKFGTWLAVDTCGSRRTSSTSSSTTTHTSTTTRPHHCLGTCRWACDANYQWVLINYGCEDYYGVTGTGQIAGTGTDAMSTCNCAPPTFCCADCGTIGVTETVTPCIKGATSQLVCPGTTTTSTTTSTTTRPGCTHCTYMWWKGHWLLGDNNCLGAPGAPCYGCTYPGSDGAVECELRTMFCAPPPPPPPVYCHGTCTWYWMPDLNDVYSWVYVGPASACSWSGVSACVCAEPTEPGNDCGQTFVGGCYVPDSTTTLPPHTTTRPPGCTGYCQWVWDAAENAWSFTCSNCPYGCVCDDLPYYAGAVNGEGAVTPCRLPTTTTSTSTTSTTTQPPCSGTCYWWCNNGVWHGLYSTCYGSDPACQCYYENPPPVSCQPGDNFNAQNECQRTTTTTSTTTSTTSTSTSTSTAGTPWYCYELYDCGPIVNGEDCFGSTCSTYIGRSCYTYPQNRCQAVGGLNRTSQYLIYSGPYADWLTCNAACPNPGTTTTEAPTTTSTTTSPPGCTGTCIWTCNGTSWDLTGNTCSSGCTCGSSPVISCTGENAGSTQMEGCIPV